MLKTRVLTALALVALFGGILFGTPPAIAGWVFAGIAALAAWEWAGLMRQQGSARVLYAGLTLVFCWQLGTAGELIPLLLGLSAGFWLCVVPVWFRRRWPLTGNDFVGYAVGGLVILPTWAAMVALHSVSPWLLVAAMALVWVADIAAYFSGRAFGRRKLAPTISPGKTWEGVAGAIVGVFIYGALVLTASPLAPHWPFAVPVTVLLLLLLTVVSIAGDLFESMLKRQAGLKDSSHLLPGHGGVLDRIDALTSTLPLAALLLLHVQS